MRGDGCGGCRMAVVVGVRGDGCGGCSVVVMVAAVGVFFNLI